MISIRTISAVASLLVCLSAAAAPQPIAIRGVTIVDVKAGRELHGMTVLIRGDHIAEVGKRIRVPANARIIDGAGKYLIPGLWDMHVHLQAAGESSLPVFIANGVTGVRDMGSGFALVSGWRDRIKDATLIGPRIQTPGPILESARFMAILGKVSSMLDGQTQKIFDEDRAQHIGVGSPAEAERIVNGLAADGVDFIKIRTAQSSETYWAIANAARKAHLTLAGHVPDVVSLADASQEGERSLEHVFFDPGLPVFTDAQVVDLAKSFLRNGTYLVPTLVSGHASRLTPDAEVAAFIDDDAGVRDPRRKYASKRLVDEWRMGRALDKFESPADWKAAYQRSISMLRVMHMNHVPIMAGTDLSVRTILPGFSVHDELALLVQEVGLTPAEALASATVLPARFFGFMDSTGTIERGKRADLVLLGGDPLADIHNTTRIAAVILNGRLFDRDQLDELLQTNSSN